MSEKVINYVALCSGRCGLTLDSESEVLRKQGTDNVRFVRPATQEEVNWVENMGGYVPKGGILGAAKEQT